MTDDNGVFKNVKIAVPLKYFGNFWRSLITNTKVYVPIATLTSKDNATLVKLLEEGFKIPVYWNEYQTKRESKNLGNNNLTRFPLDASFQGVRRLFVLAFNITTATVPNN